ncbi:la-related protein 7-like isoform X2 [Xenia sp. Carnegie-2017]|uniref:la-related protein 7-like isoform X2 n=1 Tax=Xenia sp. Carnegie-2017 TaxID=2897299 RepID=UPI001F035D05|nr:la-related protein 7-like isoform X2 [Xenia sp. Carnegie-2017]
MEGNNAKSDKTDNFESKGNDIPTEKKQRHREKKVIADPIKQIEFYFSDPNLQKDRFLRQKITESENGSIEIGTIANFNRMKQLCGDFSLVVKAMKRCSSIEVIDEKWLKLSKPLPEPKNVDLQTIYVEGLPSNAEHKWLKSLFSSCGNVVYVSLPLHKLNKKIKGFAFVEFENESEADAALKSSF